MAEPKSFVIFQSAAGLTLNSAGDNLASFLIVEPFIATEVGVHFETVGTGTFVADFDRRITFGTDTGRVDKALGTVTGTVTGGIAVGKILKRNCNVKLDPGDTVQFQCTTGLTTTGTGSAYMKGYWAGTVTQDVDQLISTT